MKSTKSLLRRGLRFASLTAALLLLSACTINIGLGDRDSNQSTASDDSAFSAADVMFAQMMIPHHEQALEMSVIALERSTNGDVRDLAQRIYDGQGPEIEKMERWIDQGSATGGMVHEMPDGSMMPNGMMDGEMMDGHEMAGMASAEELAELGSLQSPDFDILFLQLMIDHHEGALAMVEMIEDSANPEVSALARAIKSAQSAEINEMTELLERLSGSN